MLQIGIMWRKLEFYIAFLDKKGYIYSVVYHIQK